MEQKKALKMLADYDSHYKYNSDYMRDILEHSPEGFDTLAQFLPMARFRKEASTDVYFVAKIATMKAEDCGECLQLNIRFALENEVSREIVGQVLAGGDGLPNHLKDIYDFTEAIVYNRSVSSELQTRIEARNSRPVLAELALAIASARIFPTLKRTLGYDKSCKLVSLEV